MGIHKYLSGRDSSHIGSIIIKISHMKMETSNKNGKENYIINGQSIGRAY